MSVRRIAITGAQGFVGRKLTRALEDTYELTLLDVQPSMVILPSTKRQQVIGSESLDKASLAYASRSDRVPDHRSILLDVRELRAVQEAIIGCDAVIHLAIASGHEGTFEDDDFNALRFDINVNGTFNVLEAARRAGVQRIVYASSLMVVWGYAADEHVGPDAAAKPVGTYALTKYLGEVMCEQYARQFGMSIICLRMAKPIDPSDPDDRFAKQRTIPAQWIHIEDLCQAFRRAVQANNVEFEIMHLVGESSKRRWDLSKAERLLGYRARYRLEEMGYELT